MRTTPNVASTQNKEVVANHDGTMDVESGPIKPTPIPFALTILGAGSATPSLRFHHSAQLLTIGTEQILIDCGEGTQIRLIEQRIRPSKLRYIFISHLHGDHYFGLAPLLSSLNLSGRTEDLYIFGPRGLDEVLTTIFRVSNTQLSYKLHFQAIDPEKPSILLDLPLFTVESIPLEHRIDCTGFLFREKPQKPHLIRSRLPADTPIAYLKQLKNGEDVLGEDGQLLYAAADFTEPAAPPRAYAYCSDTRYVERIIPQIRHVNLVYHEATFLKDNTLRAYEVFHSTAQQAAQIAALAQIGQLIIGHFSSRYKQLDLFLEEARNIFPETYLAVEGQTIAI